MEAPNNENRLPGAIWRSGFLHGMLILAGLIAVAALWGWLMQVTVSAVDVRHAILARAAEIIALAGVDTGDVMFELDRAAVAERVSTHPWVRTAGVTRWPTGKLVVSVRERSPVVLVLGNDGREDFYLDEDGFQMPLADSTTFDLPLMSGYPESFHPESPTRDSTVLAFLDDYSREEDRVGPLVSEVVRRTDGFWLYLEPAGDRASTPVRLGTDGFREKLARLESFWNQRVLADPDRVFDLIDLRFSSQIVTREHEGE